jgi:hypothetical protein
MKVKCIAEMKGGNPVICMSTKNLDRKLPEIIRGIKKLMDENYTYQDSIEFYRKRVLKSGFPLENIWTFDGSFSITKG